MRKMLHLGAGHNPNRYLQWKFMEDLEGEVEDVTLDIAESTKPDVLFDLNILHMLSRGTFQNHQGVYQKGKLPFADEEFEQIHAYEVLEHFGRQGDWRGFFAEWREYHRVLKMGGIFAGSVPIKEFMDGDPGHSRRFNHIVFSFLQQKFIQEDRNKTGCARTDYSAEWGDRNFHQIHMQYDEEKGRLWFALQKQPYIDYNKATKAEEPPPA